MSSCATAPRTGLPRSAKSLPARILAGPSLAVMSLAALLGAPGALAGVIDNFETGDMDLSLTAPASIIDSETPSPGHCIATERHLYLSYPAGSTGELSCNLVPLSGQDDAVVLGFPDGAGDVYFTYIGGPWDLTENGTQNRITVVVGDADPGVTVRMRMWDSATLFEENATISGAGNYQFAFPGIFTDPTAIESLEFRFSGGDGQTVEIREIRTSNGSATTLIYRAWEPRGVLYQCAAATPGRSAGEQRIGWDWAIDWPTPLSLAGPSLEVLHLSAPGCVNVGFDAWPEETQPGALGMVTVDWQAATFSGASFEFRFATDPLAGYGAQLVGDPVLTIHENSIVVTHDVAITGAVGIPDGLVRQELLVAVHPAQGAGISFAEVLPEFGEGAGYVLQFALTSGAFNPASPLLEIFTVADFADDAGATGAAAAPRHDGEPSLRANPSVTRGGMRFVLPPESSPGAVVDVFDVAGRLVRTLAAAGGEARWDGSGLDGRRAPAGVYFGRESTRGATARVVLLR